jgi:hypothetical protein
VAVKRDTVKVNGFFEFWLGRRPLDRCVQRSHFPETVVLWGAGSKTCGRLGGALRARPPLWGGQSSLQPAFSRPLRLRTRRFLPLETLTKGSFPARVHALRSSREWTRENHSARSATCGESPERALAPLRRRQRPHPILDAPAGAAHHRPISRIRTFRNIIMEN